MGTPAGAVHRLFLSPVVTLLGWILVAPALAVMVDVPLGDAGATSNFRWLDVANQEYSAAFQSGFDYSNGNVSAMLTYENVSTVFAGTLVANGLKPNFAYQIKIEGNAGGRTANEGIGLAGRWWQEDWVGRSSGYWGNGTNLNIQPNPDPAYYYPGQNPNDATYFSRRDVVNNWSPTGYEYNYTGYLLLDYFITDATGSATTNFRLDDSYHVLWTTAQRAYDDSLHGPIVTAALDAGTSYALGAYGEGFSGITGDVDIYGEVERFPESTITLPRGEYTNIQFMLTEESFHADGIGGGWAQAMNATVSFSIVPEPSSMLLGLALCLPLACCRRRRSWQGA